MSYPGMRLYTDKDAASFRGRDQEIVELLGRLLAGEREIYVIGPSSSGKSSLVMADVGEEPIARTVEPPKVW